MTITRYHNGDMSGHVSSTPKLFYNVKLDPVQFNLDAAVPQTQGEVSFRPCHPEQSAERRSEGP